jgi:hypothetical protein
MLHRLTLAAAAAVAAGALLVAPMPGQAQLSPAGQAAADAIARAELAYLTPAVRAEVERRATGGNTLRGVMATMLLNSAGEVAAQMGGLTGAATIVAWDFVTGNLVVRYGDRLVLMPFDQTTLTARRPS